MLAGVSHECNFPPVVSCLPVVTRPRYGIPLAADHAAYGAALAQGAQSRSRAIDDTISKIRLDALSPYLLDADLLATLRPDLVLTQDMCDVCAPSLEEVRRAVRAMCGPQTSVLSLSPQRLDDIWANVRAVGDALGLSDAAIELVARLRSRLQAVRDRVSSARVIYRSVLTLEWFDPVMNGGLWMPELVQFAGGIEVDGRHPVSGEPLAAEPGSKSRVLSREELWQLDPDIIVLKPCGFMVEDGLAELPALLGTTPWNRWKAVARGEAYLMDGSAYFNRPGPRLAESCELLAAALHPALFPEIRARHGHEVLRIGPSLEALPW